MSVENVKKFLERVESNKNLSQKLEKAKNELNRIDTNLKNYEHIINTKIIPIAKEAGFDFTTKDFLEYANEIFSELDEKDLLNVSGGSLPKKGLVGLSFLLAFAPFAPNFIAGAEVKTKQSSQSPQSNQSAQRKNSSEFNKFKPSKIKSFAPTIFGGKSIEEQEKDYLVNYMKKNNITDRAQVSKKDLSWFDKAVKSTGKHLTENTINGTYYLEGTIPDESQTNELNLIHKWYVAQKSEPHKQKQSNINFSGLNLSSKPASESSLPNQNADNRPIVDSWTSSKDESTNAEFAANAGASSESAAAATVNSGTTPANKDIAAPPVINPVVSSPNEANPELTIANENVTTPTVVNPAASATNEVTAAPVNPETSSAIPDEAEPVSPVSNSEGSSTNESTSKETKIVAETKKATPNKFANQANLSSADLNAAVKKVYNIDLISCSMDSDGEVHGLDEQGKHHVLDGKKLFKVHYEAVDHNLPIQEQFNYVYNTLEKINSFDDLDDSRRFFVVDFHYIIGATYNAATDTFEGANDTMKTKLHEFCFKNGIRSKVGYIVNSDENLSSVQLIDRLAETIERANNDINNISNRENFIRDIKKIVCAKNSDSEYGDFVLPPRATQKDHENLNLVRNFYQNNINDADMRVTYWGRNSKLTDEENIDNLIRTGNRINSLQELNDDEVTQSSLNFLTDLDYFASLIKYEPYLRTSVFYNLPVNSENIEKARNLENIYYHLVSPKIKYTRPDNFYELSLQDKAKYLSDFNKNNDEEFLILLDLDKKSAIEYSKDVANVDTEYKKTFPDQQENTAKKQNTNNKSQASGTPSNKVKKYEEVPLSVVSGAKNRRKRIELLKSGTKISTDIKK